MLGLNKINPFRRFSAVEWFSEASQQHPLTPDLWDIQQRHHHRVFVYGTMQDGHPQHKLIAENSCYVTSGYTDDKYTLWKKELGAESFPIALEGSGWRRPDWNRPSHGRIQGELYAVTTAQLLELDKHFQNTLEFNRKRIQLIIPFRRLFRISTDSLYPHSVKNHINEKLGITEQVVQTENNVELVKAFMYIGKPEYWSDQLEHFFAPTGMFTPRYMTLGWLGDYYSFTKREYK